MRLVCDLPSTISIQDVAPFVDGVLLKDSTHINEDIECAIRYKVIPIYQLNEMMFPEEVEEYKKKILKTKDTACLYYVTDIGLAHMLKQFNLIARVIYDPVTMLTNHLDVACYQEYGFHALGISNEILLSDQKKIIELTKVPAFLQIFGYRLMQTSRRKLLSLYATKLGKSLPKEELTIREVMREEHYPIYEDEHGTKIYRGYLISLLEELKDLSLAYGFVSGKFIEKEVFLKVLQCFKLKKENPSNMEVMEHLQELNLPIETGFSYQDTVYQKEEF